MSKNNSFILVLASILFLLVSCSAPPSSAVLDDKTCEVPCWRGIQIGDSNDRVLQLVSEMKDVQQETVVVDENPLVDYADYDIDWNFDKTLESRGDIFFQQGKVNFINFDYYSREATLGRFIAKYGEPSYVLVTYTNFVNYLTAVFFYPELGVCLNHDLMNDYSSNIHDYSITQDTVIRSVDIVDTTNEDWQIKQGCAQGMERATYEAILHKWTGYGAYKSLIYYP